MCYAIYLALIALLLIYSDYALETLALSENTGTGEWTLVALGWEMIPLVWPVLLLGMVAASAVTFIVTRSRHH